MKKLTLSVLMFLTFSMSIGQSNQPSAILRYPKDANGFLILSRELNPQITQWNITITKPDPDRPGESISVYQNHLAGTFFDFIAPESIPDNGSIIIRGMNSNGDVILTETNAIGDWPPSQYTCEWMCLGSDYVYGIHAYTTINGTRLKIVYPPVEEEHQPTNGFDRYYEWYTYSDFISGGPNGPINPYQRYALSNGFDISPSSVNIQDQRIIFYNTGVSEYFQNRFGDPITGNLIGVQKYLGPFYQYATQCMSNPLMEDGCSTLLTDGAIQLINQNTENPGLMACDGFSGSGPGDPTFEVDDCVEEFYDNLGYTGGFNVYQIFSVPCGLAGDIELAELGNVSNTGTPFVWPNSLNAIRLTNLSEEGVGEIILNKSTFFNEAGNYLFPNIIIPKGFYLISYQIQGGKIANAYRYNPETNASGFTQADFVTYGAYPVPITDDDYTLNIHATQRVSFRYELRDINGVLKHSERFVVEKDKTLEKTITPVNGIESGVYTNVLIFTDGSQISFQTVK